MKPKMQEKLKQMQKDGGARADRQQYYGKKGSV